jgi:hypothetical protein
MSPRFYNHTLQVADLAPVTPEGTFSAAIITCPCGAQTALMAKWWEDEDVVVCSACKARHSIVWRKAKTKKHREMKIFGPCLPVKDSPFGMLSFAWNIIGEEYWGRFTPLGLLILAPVVVPFWVGSLAVMSVASPIMWAGVKYKHLFIKNRGEK